LKDAHREYGAILEYLLPYDGRRPDVVFLVDGAVVVLELKGKSYPSQADIDQAAAYGRDLRSYHRECHNRPVYALLIPTGAKGYIGEQDGVFIMGPDEIDKFVAKIKKSATAPGPSIEDFLADDVYSPLPTLVEAARELFLSKSVREIWQAKALTDPAVDAISKIAHRAAQTRTRHLVMITGVPGAGKTLVGMRAVHAHYLDDLAVERQGGKPTVPGLYLTGNGPLAEVLQYELRKAGGGGTTFVRHIKSYLDANVPKPNKIPPEHLLVFDEAQRAFSSDMVFDKHPKWSKEMVACEPELFIRLCDRMPEWSVMIGLIGGGQEIYLGEEEGLTQWVEAVQNSAIRDEWTVHVAGELKHLFNDAGLRVECDDALSLDKEIRFHLQTDLHLYIEALFDSRSATQGKLAADSGDETYQFRDNGIRLYVTRDLDLAKEYLFERYAEDPRARFGMVASSRDRDLVGFGVMNDFQSTKDLKIGPWFSEGPEHEHSCRHLERPVTEFQAQGLELDMALLCWGTDLVRKGHQWNIDRARNYRPQGRTRPKDPYQMRLNAYRVLLTRGRDGTVVYVPEIEDLDETFEYLVNRGFRKLNQNQG
jgi:hypothetical protein